MTDSPTETLRVLADRLNDLRLHEDPFTASSFGVREYDALVPDASAAAASEFRAAAEAIGAAAADVAAISVADRMLREAVVAAVRTDVCWVDLAAEDFTVSALPVGGPALLFMVAAQTVVSDERAAADYLARINASAGWIDQLCRRLRDGAAAGRVPVASVARKAVSWADEILADPTLAGLTEPRLAFAWAGAADWTEELTAVVDRLVRPAFKRWRDLAQDELLPVARADDACGLSALPGGEAAYRAAIEQHTTVPLTAAELHATGLTLVDTLTRRIVDLGATLGLPDFTAVREAFRAGAGADPQAALTAARQAVGRAEALAGDMFSAPLPPPCAVEPMPESVAVTGMAPHYTLPLPDGSRPGTYWFNTKTATVGTGWDVESVAFHEAVPGHHLQLARAQLLTDLPALLRQGLVTVHAEGWGLYCEQLADECGMYSDTSQRIGALFLQMHRAGRLVVDTGLHALGWSRDRALAYLAEHVPLPDAFLTAEVDRYICWPGQALAYQTGMQEILRLRADAVARLGPDFDLRGFHGELLDHGSLPIPALRLVVEDWVSRCA